ncbi:MAG: MFS transporter [Acidimicrobiales bacterium]
MTPDEAVPGGLGRAVASSSGALTVAILPLFLFGALSGRIGDDLRFGPAATGAALAVFFVSGGLTAVPIGWVTGRLGAPTAMRVGVTISGASSIAIGWLASSWFHVAGSLAVAGLAIGFVDTAASAWFAAAVPTRRQGLAFGVKEASVPMASLLAGLSIPLLAGDLGWRTVFVLSALLVPLVWVAVPTAAPPPPPVDPVAVASAKRWGPLVLFAVGMALGVGAATAAATFLVPGLEDRGWTADGAGFLLAVASISSMVARLVFGGVSDRRPGALWPIVVASMLLGATGPVLLATGLDGPVPVIGAMLTLGLGWGWTGVAYHAVLVATRDRPALGAGIVLGGLSLGGASGPVIFGTISADASFAWAWTAAGGALAGGAVLTAVARLRQRPADENEGSPVLR